MQLFNSFALHAWQELPFSLLTAQLWSEERTLLSAGACSSRILQSIPFFHTPSTWEVLDNALCNWNKTICKIVENSSELVHLISFCQLQWFNYWVFCCSLFFYQALPLFLITWPKCFFQSCFLTSIFYFPANTCPFSWFCLLHNTGLYLLLSLKAGPWIRS